MTPHGTPNLIYITGFWAIDDFSSAARNPEVGGPSAQREASSSPRPRSETSAPR